jgi:hypothetical protein
VGDHRFLEDYSACIFGVAVSWDVGLLCRKGGRIVPDSLQNIGVIAPGLKNSLIE